MGFYDNWNFDGLKFLSQIKNLQSRRTVSYADFSNRDALRRGMVLQIFDNSQKFIARYGYRRIGFYFREKF